VLDKAGDFYTANLRAAGYSLTQVLLQRYVPFMTPELLLPIALLIIMLVLTVRPSGLFGKPVVRRV